MNHQPYPPSQQNAPENPHESTRGTPRGTADQQPFDILQVERAFKLGVKCIIGIPLTAAGLALAFFPDAQPDVSKTETTTYVPETQAASTDNHIPPQVSSAPPYNSENRYQPEGILNVRPNPSLPPDTFIAQLEQKIASQGKPVDLKLIKKFDLPDNSSADTGAMYQGEYGGKKIYIKLRIAKDREGKEKVIEATGTFPKEIEIPKW